MSKKAKRSPKSRLWQRLFWWSGIACLVCATTALYFDTPGILIVSLGGAGLLLCLMSIIIEVRCKGFTADSVTALSACLALSCGVFGYFFQHTDWAIPAALIGFLLFFFVSLGAQVRGQWNDTKALWQRWKDARANKKAIDDPSKRSPTTLQGDDGHHREVR